eukprot:3622464-Ditylum_brightwellii.AAC.1
MSSLAATATAVQKSRVSTAAAAAATAKCKQVSTPANTMTTTFEEESISELSPPPQQSVLPDNAMQSIDKTSPSLYSVQPDSEDEVQSMDEPTLQSKKSTYNYTNSPWIAQ